MPTPETLALVGGLLAYALIIDRLLAIQRLLLDIARSLWEVGHEARQERLESVAARTFKASRGDSGSR